jgi:aconitate hydratase
MNTENEKLYQWSETSTFIRPPSYLEQMLKTKSETEELLKNMRCLLKVEDNISSDYISPAGSIVRTSPAADYLTQWGLVPRQFHSYGARRGNSEIMSRGTFSHARIKNVMKGHAKIGPFTLHQPSGVATTIFDASARYKTDQVPLVIIAGENFGRGTPRDWATKGPFLLGVRAILAISFSPGYKANMVKTGLLPVEINRETFNNLTGLEAFNIKMDLENDGECKDVEITLDKGEVVFKAIHRLDNAYEVNLFKNGGVLRQSLCGFLDGNK